MNAMSNPTCLIVDDHLLFAKGLERYILERDPSVTCSWAKDYPEALAYLQNMEFDFIFVDIHLGRDNGVDVVKTACEKYPDIYCVAMSGDENVFLAKSMIMSGACSYISKAIGSTALRKAIDNALDKEPSIPIWLIQSIKSPNSPEEELNSLAPRLIEIAKMIVDGSSNKTIANHQGVTENTIKTQVRRLYQKTGVSTRSQFISKFLSPIRNME